ncbi:uncharacterized protein LY79DRAFT_308004 [Colletotrichum navitas]|uniref:Secreted protein n=1 Tax=Colletotrichum navitas TaxID=681940 RepID=A0AAD8PTJ9_9PEZI|nr:uncharacterized protein LY79DRAFT_308004 [Colletotrichum navitas]KAK1580450.1 hypothetical protein LY79DRAFT_308004 [Colletotrichum navitas]
MGHFFALLKLSEKLHLLLAAPASRLLVQPFASPLLNSVQISRFVTFVQSWEKVKSPFFLTLGTPSCWFQGRKKKKKEQAFPSDCPDNPRANLMRQVQFPGCNKPCKISWVTWRLLASLQRRKSQPGLVYEENRKDKKKLEKKTCPPSPVYDAVSCNRMGVVFVVVFLDNKPRKIKSGTE